MYREDLIKVQQNGIVLRCPGLFDGEAIVLLEESGKSIVIAMMVMIYCIALFSFLFFLTGYQSKCWHSLFCVPQTMPKQFSSMYLSDYYYFLNRKSQHGFVLLLIQVDTGNEEVHLCPTCLQACFSPHHDELILSNDIGAVTAKTKIKQVF